MKLLIAGDFCPQNIVSEKFEQGDFESVLGEVKDVISNMDYSVVNFECAVAYGNEKKIRKCGPNLMCSDKGIEALKWAGFDCITLANNHFLDYGDEGVKNTIEAAKRLNVDIVGGGLNLEEASRFLLKEINGVKVAIINCCEHEFSIATNNKAGSNPLNPIQQFYTIRKIRSLVDHIILIVHGGHEQYPLPSPRMQEVYRFFIDSGADIVVNHHQHCFSGFEIYKGKPIYYGLGNFCFYTKPPVPKGWNYGYMVVLELDNHSIESTIIPYCQCKENTIIRLLSHNAFDAKIEELNQIKYDRQKLNSQKELYYQDSMRSVALAIEPYRSKIISALQSRNMLPLSWKKDSLLCLENYVMCEAHRDKLEYYFKNIL